MNVGYLMLPIFFESCVLFFVFVSFVFVAILFSMHCCCYVVSVSFFHVVVLFLLACVCLFLLVLFVFFQRFWRLFFSTIRYRCLIAWCVIYKLMFFVCYLNDGMLSCLFLTPYWGYLINEYCNFFFFFFLVFHVDSFAMLCFAALDVRISDWVCFLFFFEMRCILFTHKQDSRMIC